MFCVVSQFVCGSAFICIVLILGCARLFELFVVSLDLLSELGCFGFAKLFHVVPRFVNLFFNVLRCFHLFPFI